MRADIIPGAAFPDYELPDHTGQKRRLSGLQGNSPLVLNLARGGYCPREHLHHTYVVGLQHALELSFCQVVTISTDSVLQSREWRSRLGANWPFLSDEGRIVQRDLDIREYTDPGHDAMVPYTLVLEPGLVVYRIYDGYWFVGRPTPHELWTDLREVSRTLRPDWDITAPHLKEAWARGDKKGFYPY